MGKSYFLSESDNQKFGNISMEEMANEVSEQDLKKIYTKLNEKYNINQPSSNVLMDYSVNYKSAKSNQKKVNTEKTECAAYVYIRVIYSLVRWKRKQNSKFSLEYSRYFEKHVKKNERYIQGNSDEDRIVLENLFFFLSMLDDYYRECDDKNGYIQTTYKLYKLYSTSDLNLFYFKNKDYYSIVKNAFIKRALQLNEKNFFFGDDEKLFKSYILALCTSDDPYPVLILGETGTGKENLAQRIHKVSSRRDNSFQTLNCAAIPETLFDSEISGVIKGVATNVFSRLGIFLAACSNNNEGYRVNNKDKIVFKNKEEKYVPTDTELRRIGGTVFLDEINSIPTFLQAKLLRIIEENEVRVVGEEWSRKINVKLICASNTDLYNEAMQGDFRDDLYYRISGLILKLPPLREMKDSLIEIAQHKLSDIVEEIGYDKTIKLSEAAKNKIQCYDWPGNFRELNNILYRAINEIRIEGKNKVNGSHIVFPSTYNQPSKTIDNVLAGMSHAELEKKYIISILKKTGGNITKATELAGFGTRTPLSTRMKKYGI